MRFAGLAATAAAATALFASHAWADTAGDPAVTVKPGMWKWESHVRIMGVFSKSEENLECLIPEKASMKLSALARDLDKSCGVDNVSPTDTGYDFRLVCKGDISGKAKANISHVNGKMALSANGSARWGIIWGTLNYKANATYQGDCDPEEEARQREKWLEEQAREKAEAAKKK